MTHASAACSGGIRTTRWRHRYRPGTSSSPRRAVDQLEAVIGDGQEPNGSL